MQVIPLAIAFVDTIPSWTPLGVLAVALLGVFVIAFLRFGED